MRRLLASDVVLKALGLLLLTAAVLKGHELLTVPVANKDLWSWRPFLIFQVEFELGMAIWLLSGVFKRLAWLAALACFALFCCVTLYKALTGAASCGCFGRVHVRPWITLLAIDLPSVVALILFRPGGLRPQWVLLCLRSSRRRILTFVRRFFEPLPSWMRFVSTAGLGLATLGTTTPILALNKPAIVTSKYEVLEPKTWVGKELPILKYIDIADQIKEGMWLILFYHHDCPDCQAAVTEYEAIVADFSKTEQRFRLALVEIPPYDQGSKIAKAPRVCGKLSAAKLWLVKTPLVIAIENAQTVEAWVDVRKPLRRVAEEFLRCQTISH